MCPSAERQEGIFYIKIWDFVRNIVPLQAKSKTNDMKRIKMPLLARIILAILLGVIFGNFFNEAAVRAFLTFNGIFSQFLGFMIPLIIIGLVTPAIADIGHGAGKLLLATVGIAFADTILAGLLAYGTGSTLFPHMIANSAHVAVDKVEELKPFFEIKIPAMVDVMSALVFSFIAGLGIAHKGSRTMQKIFQEFKEIVSGVIAKVIIPLLPLYIFGIFLGMTFSGEAYHILLVFAQIILVILVLHIVILLYEYLLAGGYNIIFAWDDLNELARYNIESARGKLMDILSNYQGYKKMTLILVFDAYKVKGNQGEVGMYHNIHVVYTKEAETADQYIEKTVHRIGHNGNVTVASSDGLEQIIIMGAGAHRLSARDLRTEIEHTNGQIRENYLEKEQKTKSYLLENASGELGDFLKELEEERKKESKKSKGKA